MKKIFYFTIIFLILYPNLGKSQLSFTFSSDKPCARTDYTFTPTGYNLPDSIVWVWNDGTKSTLVDKAPFVAIHKFTIAAINTVIAREYKGGVMVGNAQNDIVIYDKPNLSMEYFASSTVCAPTDTIEIEVDSINVESKDLSLTIDWGDGSDNETYKYSDLGNRIEHIYKKTSCGNNVTIGSQKIDNKFIIMISSKNICVDILPEIIFRTVDIKSRPTSGFKFADTTVLYDGASSAFQKCESGDVKLINESANTEDNCLNVNNVVWKIYDADNKLVDECSFCDKEFETQFDKQELYKVVLSQENECGEGIITKNVNVRELPHVWFQIAEKVHCYPAKLTFVNTSGADLEKFYWDFIGDSSNVTVDSLFESQEHIYTNKGEYNIKLYGLDKFCRNEHDTIVNFENLCEDLYVPNAFIPDSPNDKLRIFRPKAQNLKEYKIEIYNIQGKHLWTSEELIDGVPKTGWDGIHDGKKCPQGTYIWKIYALIDQKEFGTRVWEGIEYKTDKKRTSGTFYLIR